MGIMFVADRVSIKADPKSPCVVFSSESVVVFSPEFTVDPHRLEFNRNPENADDKLLVEVRCDLLGVIHGINKVLLTPTRIVVVFDESTGSLRSKNREFVTFVDKARGRSRANHRELVVSYHTTAGERKTLRETMKQIFSGTVLFVDDAVTGWALLDAVLSGPATPTSEMLVVPTYMTLVVGAMGGIVAGLESLWLIPLGILAGVPLGFLYGYVIKGRFYSLHKYR